ncbi:MAG TPA: hypothetical protein PLR50_00970, partial [Candidatus Rifleibacterium sp.]|nr:hypothetical protein [Candidatus Rifleibacterium sp.]
TTITVPNHKTIVIGGLMREDKTKVIEKVPLLSKIPFIGEAFKNRRDVTQKTNLLVFITPHILSTPEEVLKFDEARGASTEETKLEEVKKTVVQKQQAHENQFRDRALKAFERLKTNIDKK